jgi:hypothetical protein
MISTVTMDRDQLRAQLDDIKARTKSSVELTTRLIDQSFLRFKASHRTLYAVRQSPSSWIGCSMDSTRSAYGVGRQANLW